MGMLGEERRSARGRRDDAGGRTRAQELARGDDSDLGGGPYQVKTVANGSTANVHQNG